MYTPPDERRFRILLLGDFSGRAGRNEPAPAKLRPLAIDRDHFDEVIARMCPALKLGRAGALLQFRELEDFHPDHIYERSPLFEKMRQARCDVSQAGSRAEAEAVAAPSPGELPALAGPDEWQAFIRQAVQSSVEAPADPALRDKRAGLDTAAGEVMRALLHHPDFQKLEAAWRAVHWLVHEIESDVFLLDVPKLDLAASLRELRRILVEGADTRPWALVVGNFRFARTEADGNLLRELGKIMQATGAPLVAEADPAEADSEASAQCWSALRRSEEAAWLGLALPRFLLRLPYGRATNPIEGFAFEEMPALPEHEHYLWGNPGFAIAYLLGQAFDLYGPDLHAESFPHEIEGLPLHVYEADGEEQLTPCAEVFMTEEDVHWILEQGFMPLASLKNQDAVRLVRFQSIAEPLTPLSGRWS